ncbi:hypothetical protein ILYODFUR_000957 [Ilyodon furcidens]|uniref:Uncharacterized protein n=1 Tax=Ilyodon furcidens TaxID=33524 RepID=A0ABV0SIP9_9TELE
METGWANIAQLKRTSVPEATLTLLPSLCVHIHAERCNLLSGRFVYTSICLNAYGHLTLHHVKTWAYSVQKLSSSSYFMFMCHYWKLEKCFPPQLEQKKLAERDSTAVRDMKLRCPDINQVEKSKLQNRTPTHHFLGSS